MKAEIVHLYAYDIAQEADLSAIESSMRGRAERFDLGRLKDAPRDFPVYRPVSIQLKEIAATGPRGPLTLYPSVKLFAIGAMSLKVRIPLDCETLSDLSSFRGIRTDDGATLDDRVHVLARQVFDTVRAKLDTPVTELPQPEGYTVWCLDSSSWQDGIAGAWLGENQRAIAALLVGEPDASRLSTQEVQETTQYRYSYYQHDLAIIDWDAALLLDRPADYNDTLYVMEMANLQLEELRVYDQRLDQALDKAYADVEEARRPYRFGARQRVLNELRQLKMDVTKVTDEISNISKFFGDWHLARLYMGCAARFHLSEWANTISQKLRALDGLYTMLQQDGNNRIMLILEASIVALFVIDLVIIVLLKEG